MAIPAQEAPEAPEALGVVVVLRVPLERSVRAMPAGRAESRWNSRLGQGGRSEEYPYVERNPPHWQSL